MCALDFLCIHSLQKVSLATELKSPVGESRAFWLSLVLLKWIWSSWTKGIHRITEWIALEGTLKTTEPQKGWVGSVLKAPAAPPLSCADYPHISPRCPGFCPWPRAPAEMGHPQFSGHLPKHRAPPLPPYLPELHHCQQWRKHWGHALPWTCTNQQCLLSCCHHTYVLWAPDIGQGAIRADSNQNWDWFLGQSD